MKNVLSEIQQQLEANATTAKRDSQEKFVPGTGRMYGVSMPVLNKMAAEYKRGGFELVEMLWQAGAHEEKMLAIKILGKIAKKDPSLALRLAGKFAREINSWEICDGLGMQALKPIFKTHQAEIFALAGKLNRSKDPWQRRLSLVLVEWYTRDPHLHIEIKKLIRPLESDPEYYVKKAITWLRKNFEKGK